MKPYILSLLLIATLSKTSFSQLKEAPVNLKQQATKMSMALVSKDFETFVSYTYPSIVKLMGGSAKMIEVLNKSTEEMKGKGISIDKVTIEEPSDMIVYKKELQATITQHTEIKMPEGILLSTSTLIAVSTDNGLNWTFIDTSRKYISELRKVLPNINPAMKIPPHQQPRLKN